MGKNSADLQDIILNGVRKNRIPVTMHLTNGVPLKGIIRGFDSYVVLLESDGKQQMIFKHAISTVTPLAARAVLALRERRPCKSFRRGDLITL